MYLHYVKKLFKNHVGDSKIKWYRLKINFSTQLFFSCLKFLTVNIVVKVIALPSKYIWSFNNKEILLRSRNLSYLDK